MSDKFTSLRDELKSQSDRPYLLKQISEGIYYLTMPDQKPGPDGKRVHVGFSITGASEKDYPRYISNAIRSFEEEEAV
jgi:hypothetical protein